MQYIYKIALCRIKTKLCERKLIDFIINDLNFKFLSITVERQNWNI